jgi:hypothetical protein
MMLIRIASVIEGASGGNMAFERWTPRQDHTKQEELLLGRLRRTRKLFAFLRDHRQELFDHAFREELESMYRDTGAGQDPVPPALLAMVVLLQSYLCVSDAEAVELTVVDVRWQMVLDRLSATAPACGQGTLGDFRARLIRTNMDRRLLERTVELARQTKSFDWRKLPKNLRVAIDSSPLLGAGRVEDTINLLGHAARKVVECAADLLGWTSDRTTREAGIPALLEANSQSHLRKQTAALTGRCDLIGFFGQGPLISISSTGLRLCETSRARKANYNKGRNASVRRNAKARG